MTSPESPASRSRRRCRRQAARLGGQATTEYLILGMLIAFARHEPDCAEQLAGRPSILRRSATVATSRGRRSE